MATPATAPVANPFSKRFRCYRRRGAEKALVIASTTDSIDGGLLLQPKQQGYSQSEKAGRAAARDTIAQISREETERLIEDCEKENVWFVSILGKLNLKAGTTLILITHAIRLPQAFNDGRIVYRIQEVKFMDVAGIATVQERKLFEVLKELLQDGSFFFTSEGDLTLNTQRRALGEPSDSQYIWNRSLLKDFEDAGISPPWIIRTVRGFVGYVCVWQGVTKMHSWLISRSSCGRAGTRFQTRGVDDDGYVANFVETEQLIEWEGWSVSHVQIRGSVPLFWEQPGINVGKHKVKISRTLDAMMPAFTRHFEKQSAVYGNVVCCNLLGQGEAEYMLSKAYQDHVRELQKSTTLDVKIKCFDYHVETKGGRVDKLNAFTNSLVPDLDKMDVFVMTNTHEIIRTQKGVFRTNCLDCLDRTNAVMQPIGLAALETMLGFLPDINDDPKYIQRFQNHYKDLWFDNGDRISLNYAGTGAIKADFAKLGKRTKLGLFNDGKKSVSRLYLNNVRDTHHQMAIDTLLSNQSMEEREEAEAGEDIVKMLEQRESEFIETHFISVYLATYNVNGGHCNKQVNLRSWLVEPLGGIDGSAPDIYAIGFQEIVNIDVANILREDANNRQNWEQWLKQALAEQDSEYVQVLQQQLVGVCLYVFVRKEMYEHVRDASITLHKVGMHGLTGNKGGVVGRFRLYNSSFCFVCAHLAAGQSNVDDRISDFREITQGIQFPKGRKIMDHDYVFWFGDFNFRIDMPINDVKKMIDEQDWASLYEKDQLKMARDTKQAFQDFTEAPINFCPTYKYDPNSEEWDSSDKQRIPAWTDRVLWHVKEKHPSVEDKVLCMAYDRAELLISDHRPVYAIFDVACVEVDEHKRKKVYQELKSTRGMVIVTGLPPDLDLADIRGMFTPFGRVIQLKQHHWGLHVVFSTEDEAIAACGLSGSKMMGYDITCHLAGDEDAVSHEFSYQDQDNTSLAPYDEDSVYLTDDDNLSISDSGTFPEYVNNDPTSPQTTRRTTNITRPAPANFPILPQKDSGRLRGPTPTTEVTDLSNDSPLPTRPPSRPPPPSIGRNTPSGSPSPSPFSSPVAFRAPPRSISPAFPPSRPPPVSGGSDTNSLPELPQVPTRPPQPPTRPMSPAVSTVSAPLLRTDPPSDVKPRRPIAPVGIPERPSNLNSSSYATAPILPSRPPTFTPSPRPLSMEDGLTPRRPTSGPSVSDDIYLDEEGSFDTQTAVGRGDSSFSEPEPIVPVRPRQQPSMIPGQSEDSGNIIPHRPSQRPIESTVGTEQPAPIPVIPARPARLQGQTSTPEVSTEPLIPTRPNQQPNPAPITPRPLPSAPSPRPSSLPQASGPKPALAPRPESVVPTRSTPARATPDPPARVEPALPPRPAHLGQAPAVIPPRPASTLPTESGQQESDDPSILVPRPVPRPKPVPALPPPRQSGNDTINPRRPSTGDNGDISPAQSIIPKGPSFLSKASSPSPIHTPPNESQPMIPRRPSSQNSRPSTSGGSEASTNEASGSGVTQPIIPKRPSVNAVSPNVAPGARPLPKLPPRPAHTLGGVEKRDSEEDMQD